MKQNTLFSFFTKPARTSTSSSSSATSPSSKSASSSSTSSSGSPATAKTNAVGKNGSTSGKTNSKSPLAHLDKIKVGTRLAIYWPLDEEYYPARVSSINRGRKGTDSQRLYTVVYDDGEAETLDLNGEKFRLLPQEETGDGLSPKASRDSQSPSKTNGSKRPKPSDANNDKGDNDEDEDDESVGAQPRKKRTQPHTTTQSTSSPPRRRRCIVERDGEDTEEYEFHSSSEDEEEEESDYHHQSESEGDDHDDGDLQDSSEEEDQGAVRKRKNQASKTKEHEKDKKKQCRGRLVRVSQPSTIKNPYAKKKGGSSQTSSAVVTKEGKAVVTPPPASGAASTSSTSTAKIDQPKSVKKKSSGNEEFRTPTIKRDLGMFTPTGSGNGKTPRVSSKTAGGFVTPASSVKSVSTTTKSNPKQSPTSTGIPATGKWVDGAVNAAGTHMHNHLSFLYPPKLRDAQGNLSTSPSYDPRTLRFTQREEDEVRKVTGSNLTPASRQWWELKSRYFDTILFFKTGKFYELYHMDADVGCKELGFVYMKGRDAHSGFPEGAYGLMSGRLVDRGYKVARVEQTETPDQLAKRKKATGKGKKKPQVVNREVCAITSIGTRTYCFLDDTRCFNPKKNDPTSVPHGAHGPLLCIKEVLLDDATMQDASGTDDSSPRPVCEYGITVVDAARSIITVGQFADDALRSRLHTLLTTFAPSEILMEGAGDSNNEKDGGASKDLVRMIQCSQTARVERVKPTEHFPPSTAVDPADREAVQRPNPCHPWDHLETVKELHRKGYFVAANRDTKSKKKHKPDKTGLTASVESWPEVLRACAKGGATLALSSFGATLFYLQLGLVDREILSFGDVRAYIPPGSPIVDGGEEGKSCNSTKEGKGMNEDNIAKKNDATPTVLKELSAASASKENGVLNTMQPPMENNDNDECRKTQDGESLTATTPSQPLTQPGAKVPNPYAVSSADPETDHMQLDGTTIANLDLLVNQSDQTTRNSLWARINHAKSPGGLRLLRAWLLRPLFRRADIERRMDAVDELTCGAGALAMSEVRPLLSKVGDLDRLLSRVHSMGSAEGSGDHPNARAVLYEGPQYTKRKVEDFRKLLLGLQVTGQVMQAFENCDLRSGLLCKVVTRQSSGGCFPDKLEEELEWFQENFDCEKAKTGLYEPMRGMDEDYDCACDEVERILSELEEYKKEMCAHRLGSGASSHWKYINTKPESRDKYLIELPVSVKVPPDFYVKGKRGSGAKQVNKYRTSVVEELVQALEEALDEQKAGKERGMQIVFAKFDSRRPLWAASAQATSMLDALGALAHVSSQPDFCRPEILDFEGNPTIHVEQGRHPCIDVTHNGGDFIPNDLSLGGVEGDDGEAEASGSRVLLLSGPNMGGKSTLLRQTCLIAILAQIGCFVPASACSLTPMDRIFTRLGATDRILSGQSTFFVELAETAAALRGATQRSLVIMDELGRGTSTFDGTAIASATVRHLIQRCGCLVLFATHYHSLLEDWKDEPTVRLGHMECVVEGGAEDFEEEEGDGSENDSKAMEHDSEPGKPSLNSDHNITFLYTLGEGACPRSFGINVARLAGLPSEVLSIAKRKSAAFEAELNGDEHNSMPRRVLLQRMQQAVKRGDSSEAVRLWKLLGKEG